MRSKLVAWVVLFSWLFAVTAPVDACRPPLQVVFFEGHVGTLVLTPNGKVFIVDANVPAAVQMIPYLRARGIKEIDALLVTHPHGDHFAGIPRLLRAFKIKRLIDSGYRANDLAGASHDTQVRREYRDTVVIPYKAKARNGKHVTGVVAGGTLALDKDLEIKFLGPRKQGYNFAHTEPSLTNKHSIVTYLRYGDFSVMLPGDAPVETQNVIAHDYPKETRETDVFLVPHHCRIYFGAPFAREVGSANPRARIGIASGDAMPHTFAQWKGAGIRLYRADAAHGDVTIASTGRFFTVSTSKQKGEDRFSAR